MTSVTTITDPQFETEVLQTDKPVLAYFWAAWCGPCRLVSPSVEWAAANYGDRLKVVKMEVDPNPETVKTYRVEGVPAFRIIKSGELVASLEGAITKPKLQAFIDENLG
ncbi:thioredoxin family protein [Merismopedia glauca]|uniref:Thioredoxin n=1 Tax=Merismopedia glauca CCAP 1448/3 TaxID=1296344 RepID=A0A2T1C703_9CYAN|nr:thioredoxin family protein [Merismopedia glauca]PSB04050.1 thiol reductase thioredoxin [Merismopedia glauca CCAP 1448/3]